MDDEDDAHVSPIDEEDYYAVLNVPRDATPEDLRAAYRSASRLYHPDKHPDNKAAAEALFQAVHTAYEALSDPQKRSIYDMYGVKGLQAGLQLTPYCTAGDEIKAKYERFLREKEEEKLNRRTNPKGSMTINVNASNLFDPYDRFTISSLKDSVDVNAISLNQSVEVPLLDADIFTLGGSLVVQNGVGAGNVSLGLHHQFSAASWMQMETGFGNGPYVGAKGFHTLSKYSFASLGFQFQETPYGMRPGLNVVLSRQLWKTTIGYWTWKIGMDPSINTTIMRQNENSQLSGSMQIGIMRTFISARMTRKMTENASLRAMTSLGTTGFILQGGGDYKLSETSKIGMGLSVGLPSGVVLNLKVARATQTYVFPITLSQRISTRSVAGGAILPLVLAWGVRRFVLLPMQRRSRRRAVQELRRENAEWTERKMHEAQAVVRLMQETVERKIAIEEERGGLVIVRAVYGRLRTEDPDDETLEVDVTVPLQCLVKDSTLHLHPSSKSGLVGFYDPCIGEPKFLRVTYRFKGKMHAVEIEDEAALSAPKRSHTLLHNSNHSA